MNRPSGKCPFASRRSFIAVAGGLAAAAGSGVGVRGVAHAQSGQGVGSDSPGEARNTIEPFWGEHQGGIVTTLQSHTYFAAFDITTMRVSDVVSMLRKWTDAAARMAVGQTAAPLGQDLTVPAADSGEALGLPPARLTVTFGFGAGLFVKDGKDRFGIASRRPEALVDMPRFNGDQLEDARTGGDLSVQACADGPQVAFHAVRQLAPLAYGIAQIRWVQTGFSASFPGEDTPRNLMGIQGRHAKAGLATSDGRSSPIDNVRFPQPRRSGLGWRGGPGLDAWRKLSRRTPHPHLARALGSD